MDFTSILNWFTAIDYGWQHIVLAVGFVSLYIWSQFWAFSADRSTRPTGHLLCATADVFAITAFLALTGYFPHSPWLLLGAMAAYVLLAIISTSIATEDMGAGFLLGGGMLLLLMPVYFSAWILSMFLPDFGLMETGNFVPLCFWMQYFSCLTIQFFYLF